MENKKVTISKVIDWKPDRGFGFVTVGGRRAFVHASDIRPQPDRGTDLAGKWLVFSDTTEDRKGLRVLVAMTQEEYGRQQAEKLEAEKQAEQNRLAKELKTQEVEEFLRARSEELLEKFSLLFNQEARIERSWGAYPVETGHRDIRATILPALAQVVSESPLKLSADVFAEISKVEGGTVVGTIKIGPVANLTVEGWEKMQIGPGERHPDRVIPGRLNYEGLRWDKESLTATVEFVATEFPFVFIKKQFPIVVEKPYRDKEKVMQKIACTTPCGEISHDFVLYPKIEFSDYSTYMQVWGGYDISMLIAEASEVASEQEVWLCIAEKFNHEGIPSTWEEFGDNWISHEDVGCGIGMGGDVGSATYTNPDFIVEVKRIYKLGLSKAILSEVVQIPSEAEKLGWSFKVPYQYGSKEWPTVFVLVTDFYGRTDNDLKGYKVPRWVSPVQKQEYRKVLDAVLSGMTAAQAVKSFLGDCPKASPLERQRVAEWLRICRKEGVRNYREWRNPPKVKNLRLAEHAQKIFLRLKEKQLRLESLKVEEARKASLARVRKNWRTMLDWRRGQMSGLHDEAAALLEKIRFAQKRAEYLAMSRRQATRLETQTQRAQVEAQSKKTEGEKFLGSGTWDALNGLKF